MEHPARRTGMGARGLWHGGRAEQHPDAGQTNLSHILDDQAGGFSRCPDADGAGPVAPV